MSDVETIIQEAEPAFRQVGQEGITYEMHHQNGEKTVLSAIPYSNGFVLLVADIGKDGSILKEEGIGTAKSRDAAEKGLGWWAENNPKGLDYSTIERIKMMVGAFKS